MARRAKETEEAAVYTVTSKTGLNVREMPDRASKVLRVLPCGEKVAESGKAPDGWLAIDGGYVMREYLE